jgi:hypothetical protein
MLRDMVHSTDARFEALAADVLDETMARHPEWATGLGVHVYDDRVTDVSAEAHAQESVWLARRAADLAAIETAELSPQNRVDAAILATNLASRQFAIDELREHEWNPAEANPGGGIYVLLARDFAPAAERLRCVARRLEAIPRTLRDAREVLAGRPLSKIHLELAIGQFGGTVGLVKAVVDEAPEQAPEMRGVLASARPAAVAALEEHVAWLEERLAAGNAGTETFRDPRIGAEAFARKLSLRLDAESDAAAILARAEADLDRLTAEIVEAAADFEGVAVPSDDAEASALVRRVLDGLAADAPDNDTILDLARAAFEQQTAFVRRLDLMTVHPDPCDVIVMPEINQGVAVAYCDSPGPLETADVPTLVAISPTPAAWSPERAASFFREYNLHMVHDLMVHEAMPGHVLQRQHSRRFSAPTNVRAAMWSGSFVEGWAVYAEELMAAHRYPGAGDPRAVRLQQLKMQLRMTINTILDGRVHCHGMTEDEAMALMADRGFQEEGEAAGKWRRALLSSAQLSTYYVGYVEVSDLVRDLRAAHPEWSERELHDTVLGHGSPAVRYLRVLLDL